MKHSSLRRSGALLVAATVSVAGLTAAPEAAAAAAAAEPNAPAARGASWLASELSAGLLVGQYGPDYGLSIDAALALDAVGGQEAAVGGIRDAVADGVKSYYSGSWADEDGVHSWESGGSVAKALVLATRTGGDPRSFGGVDLVQEAERLTSDDPAIAGRVIGTADGRPDLGYTNTYIQALAAEGLTVAGSPDADEAIEYLLAQQCSEGFFRGDIPAPSGDQACQDGASTPDPDSTALAVLALLRHGGDAAADAAVGDAVTWLEQAQAADGSLGGGTSTEAANANSTGLAAWALGEAGATAAAAKAAGWLGSRQAAVPAPCPLASGLGAIAYDDAALAAGQARGISADSRDQWRRATTQALPALRWLAQEPVPAPVALRAPSGYQTAGSRITVQVTGLAAREQACVVGPAGSVARTGAGTATVVLPTGTATRTIALRRLGTGATATVDVLGAKRVGFKLRKKVRRGRTQVVRVRGLAPGERVRVAYRGRSVERGRAGTTGRFTARFKAKGKPGRARVVVVGQFGDRRNVKGFKVLRR